MPVYEFQCARCGAEFERKCHVGQTRGISCPECGSRKVDKLMSAFISFKSDRSFSQASKCQQCTLPSCGSCLSRPS